MAHLTPPQNISYEKSRPISGSAGLLLSTIWNVFYKKIGSQISKTDFLPEECRIF